MELQNSDFWILHLNCFNFAWNRLSSLETIVTLHHQPFGIETNGPCNIIMSLAVSKELRKPVNSILIESQARSTIDYMLAIGNGHLPKWHEVSNYKMDTQQILSFLCRLHAKNNGDFNKTLNQIAELITEC